MVYSYIVIWLYNNKANAASVDIICTFELYAPVCGYFLLNNAKIR